MDLFLYFWVLRQPALQADEKLSHKEGEALLQRWAQESNVDYDSSLERKRCKKWGENMGSYSHQDFLKDMTVLCFFLNGELVGEMGKLCGQF